EEDFLETYRFVNELDISYLHVFTYSERANTPAAEMEGVIEVGERRRRNEMLRILSDKKQRHFYEQHINTSRPVLFEARDFNGVMSGFTDNYVKVSTSYDADITNKISNVFLESINQNGEISINVSEMSKS
ncbi:MAG: threonylcarbamoyladenosine tRNA methylthiotransferase MtaB, partial [Maribacter sp.]